MTRAQVAKILSDTFSITNDLPRYIVKEAPALLARLPAARCYSVRDQNADMAVAAGLTQANAELHAERLNSAQELRA